MDTSLFTAIVLAGDREPDNPVARAANVPCKALVPVAGIPMLFRVLNALSSSSWISRSILCGPPKNIVYQEPVLSALISSGKLEWFQNRETPCTSAWQAMQSIPEDVPVLLTTSDHALLTPEMVDWFCSKARDSGCDVAAAVVRHETVVTAYPETHRTAYRLRDGAYCSCNLFAFMTPVARKAIVFWRRVERRRKNPLLVISAFGWMTVLRYLTRHLTLAQAMDRMSRCLGCRAEVIVMPCPEAAIDVDTVDDWHLAERIAVSSSV